MTAADTYRRYAAECVSMSQRRENVRDKAPLLQMATMWLKLAELAERNESTEGSAGGDWQRPFPALRRYADVFPALALTVWCRSRPQRFRHSL